MNMINCILGHCFTFTETYAAEMFSLYAFKTFCNLPVAFEAQLCRATPWIFTGETIMLLRIALSFFFWDSYCKKSLSDTNSSCELSVSIISVVFSFSGGLFIFSYSVIHCLHNFWPSNRSLNPFSFSILAISRLITLWALLLRQWDLKMLQDLSVVLSNSFLKNC